MLLSEAFFVEYYNKRKYNAGMGINMKLNGSDIIIECLLEQGVDTVFGYPGGAVLNIYDALYK